jgi:hypothetical protein
VTQLRGIVTSDPDGDPTLPNYGDSFREEDYAHVPLRDLPFGVPAWLGDDSWGRREAGRPNNSVRRPGPGDRLDPSFDDFHTLIWTAPRS